jgi:hypothetical protein
MAFVARGAAIDKRSVREFDACVAISKIALGPSISEQHERSPTIVKDKSRATRGLGKILWIDGFAGRQRLVFESPPSRHGPRRGFETRFRAVLIEQAVNEHFELQRTDGDEQRDAR